MPPDERSAHRDRALRRLSRLRLVTGAGGAGAVGLIAAGLAMSAQTTPSRTQPTRAVSGGS